MIVTEREREAETKAEGEAGSMHREPDVGFDPGSPGSRPGLQAALNCCATGAARCTLPLRVHSFVSSVTQASVNMLRNE